MVPTITTDVEKSTTSKIAKKLMPLLVICMFIAFLDRINIAFAALTMNKDLGLSAEVFGLGAGLFFLGYVVFEVPSNLILVKVGPKRWFARIMITWGLIAAGMAFVQGAKSFYIMRVLLGLAEAGFAPGAIFLLTLWYRKRERAQAAGIFHCGSFLGAAVGAPLSGLIMTYLHGTMGLTGWQWLFIAEGLPAVIMAFVVLKYLPNRPRDAKWLKSEEREWITQTIEAENRAEAEVEHISVWQALTSPKTLLLSFIYFCFCVGALGLTIWLPQLIKALGKAQNLSTLAITLYTMLPFWLIIFSLVISGRHSDKTGERRWHLTIASLVCACGLFVTAGATSLTIGICALIVVGIGLGGVQPAFWGAATDMLDPKEAAAAIALICCVGNLGGFVGPYLVGLAKALTGEFNVGVYIFSGCFALVAILIHVVFAITKKAGGVSKRLQAAAGAEVSLPGKTQ